MRRRHTAGVLLAAVLLASCASDSDGGENGSASPSDVSPSSSADDQIDAAPVDSSWGWTGLLIQDDGVTRACFGEIETSEPPGCPNGMPIVDFDLRDTSWVDYFEQDDRTVASANITGRPTTEGFILGAPISEADGSLEPLPCEQFETGGAPETRRVHNQPSICFKASPLKKPACGSVTVAPEATMGSMRLF